MLCSFGLSSATETPENGASSCPAYVTNHTNTSVLCECKDWRSIVHCTGTSVSLRYGHCLTYNDAQHTLVLGVCPFNPLYFNHSVRLYVTLPQNVSMLNSFTCGPYHREGQQCRQCFPGYGPGVLSHGRDCVRCTCDGRVRLILFFLSQVVLATILLFVITACGLNISSGAIGTFVLFSQAVSLPVLADYVLALGEQLSATVFSKILLSFYGIWNLQFFTSFFPDFCLYKDAYVTYILALDYGVPLFLLLVTLVMFCFAKLHKRSCRPAVYPFCCGSQIVARVMYTRISIARAFATVLVLSYARISFTSLQLLYRIRPDGENVSKASLFSDASTEYAGSKHLPFLLLSILVLVMFVFLPALILTCFQFKPFQKCLEWIRLNRKGLQAFIEVFKGSYKDGLEGRRDFRFFAGLLLIVRVVIVALMLWRYTSTVSDLVVVFISLCLVLLVSLLRPHQTGTYNVVDALVFSVLLAVFATALNSVSLHVQSADSRPDDWELASIGLTLALLALPAASILAALPLLVCIKLKMHTLCVKKPTGTSPSFEQPPYDELYSEGTWSHLIPESSIDLSVASSIPDRVANPCRYQSLDLQSADGSFFLESVP